MTPVDPLEFYRLRPVRAARVSEISETTATSPVPPEERVNFHIGNPVQDERLVTAFLHTIMGEAPAEGTPEAEMLLAFIRKSAPYMPRGGYLRGKPSELVTLFGAWVGAAQPEPLSYDFGEKSGMREVVLASGGILETMRVLFHAFDRYLLSLPARAYFWGAPLPASLPHPERFISTVLPGHDDEALAALTRSMDASPPCPCFLVLGTVPGEETRRALRLLALERPIMVIEANDAPNHLSLAREARMKRRVIRLLTAGIFSPRLGSLPTVFVAGNHEIVTILEVTHFQLKGTPSATDAELLTMILKRPLHAAAPPNSVLPPLADSVEDITPALHIAHRAEHLVQRAQVMLDRDYSAATSITSRLAERITSLADLSMHTVARASASFDPLGGGTVGELCERLLVEAPDRAWQQDVTEAFLSQFLRHHPEYNSASCSVVSGSSRTALSLLGFHCGIAEVIVPDLSWTYEHCFPTVTAVPLTPDLDLDVEGIITAVQSKLDSDSAWHRTGAVALNNPHNATGRTFNVEGVRRLLRWLLPRHVKVIDDLAYQNVVPADVLEGPPTLRQIADGLVRSGYLTRDQGDGVITVHSVSKTDCLAGARLAVAEIRDPALLVKFREANNIIIPNTAAIFLSYLFYRAPADRVNAYWTLRNQIFNERMLALEEAAQNLPIARNRFGIGIRRPTGSMYPLMEIPGLPPGISLDWLSSGLARLGIGLLPLSTFARTAEGFETGRTSFRLTLGGTDSAQQLLPKTRRVLIDLNRMIAEEESRYNRRSFTLVSSPRTPENGIDQQWQEVEERIMKACGLLTKASLERFWPKGDVGEETERFMRDYLPQRLDVCRGRMLDRYERQEALIHFVRDGKKNGISDLLEPELMKDNLDARQQRFKNRTHDRTVHPTQMYSLAAELLWDDMIAAALRGEEIGDARIRDIAASLLREYLGLNVAIASADEGDELVLDLDCLICAEDFVRVSTDGTLHPFLSYWGDWDGSTRPSGQGHRLVASVVVANVARMTRFLTLLVGTDRTVRVDPALLREIDGLPARNAKFRRVLDDITLLTQQLEKRYRGVLPFHVVPSRLRRAGMRLRLASDPLTTMWEHNDRLERRMLALRQERKRGLEYYFRLNKQLRKALHALLPSIQANLANDVFATHAVGYRDLLQRFVITPRIHQSLATAQDSFAIDTTIHNIMEINEIGGAVGNPGMILALQISMSTEPEALISLDRKAKAQREDVLRRHEKADVPGLWLVPLFEDVMAVENITRYLDKTWEYSLQSRRLHQHTAERFTEILPEVFIAGSDLSQHVGQTAGAAMFRQAKLQIVQWLADRGLAGDIRIKMGSGEPMQRQGGYYAPMSGTPAFVMSRDNDRRLEKTVRESTRVSTRYATTPLMGVLAGGDMRTFQSNISEQLRHLRTVEYARLLYHVQEAQRFARQELSRAAEPLLDTRLFFGSRGQQELERWTVGQKDSLFDEFARSVTENFRSIVYGREEDVVGIHIISYFIARTSPALRDRPTFRPGKGLTGSVGQQIIERIAATIPLSRHGSLLRAISHNQAQTAILGINQLTTGLFRALDTFAERQFVEGKGRHLIADRVLPHLPVYEMLLSLRLYQDASLEYLRKMERAFPPGNSAFAILREDLDSMEKYIGLLQRELLRRHGINVADFFEGPRFVPTLLPTLRPDLAVLMQPDLFNTEFDALAPQIGGAIEKEWETAMRELLQVPAEVRQWRARAWELLEQPVFLRLQSFVELALALSSLAGKLTGAGDLPRALAARPAPKPLLRGAPDDSLRDFLSAAFEYLSGLSQSSIEVPTPVVRALKEIERIVAIEEQALPPREQDLLRCYLLQIARRTGENG